MSIIIMILLIGLLIFVHELGHFMSARMLGIKVSRFALGFPIGPTLWKKKIGDVEYLIHACLLGGYVAFPDDDKDSDLPLDSKDRFANRPVWQRMIVISAGVISNVVTAFILVILTATFWGQLPSGEYQVFANKIQAPKTESIWHSGLKAGDQIYKINGSDILTNYAISLYAKNSAKNDGKVDKNFASENLKTLKILNNKISNEKFIKAGTEIVLPQNIIEPEIKIPDKELFRLQLFNDKYESDTRTKLSEKQIQLRNTIEGKQIFTAEEDISWEDLSYAVSDTVHPINITVLRNGKKINLKPIYPNKNGVMGIMLSINQKLIQTKTPISIIKSSYDYLKYQTYMMCYGLWTIVSGKVKASELHGVVVIAKVGGDIIQNNGLFSGLLLTAVISMNLALINFLPIPALDGGHFMFLLIEKLMGKPVKQETIDKISSFFFLLLIILMVLIIFNDIYALVKHQL